MNTQHLEEWKKEFISRFTVWNDKYKFATLQGKEEYPTPNDIADWWMEKLTQQHNKTVMECLEAMQRAFYLEIDGGEHMGYKQIVEQAIKSLLK